ncbi:hypothetical protein C9426_13665 [Serratia sp. S1B]|nr:hypothetical protein C9426_13665 [Serratia sp. S1B]
MLIKSKEEKFKFVLLLKIDLSETLLLSLITPDTHQRPLSWDGEATTWQFQAMIILIKLINYSVTP